MNKSGARQGAGLAADAPFHVRGSENFQGICPLTGSMSSERLDRQSEILLNNNIIQRVRWQQEFLFPFLLRLATMWYL